MNQGLLNPANHNHALSRALSKTNEASTDLKSEIHASIFFFSLTGRDLKWNVTCK